MWISYIFVFLWNGQTDTLCLIQYNTNLATEFEATLAPSIHPFMHIAIVQWHTAQTLTGTHAYQQKWLPCRLS